ncbi:hypothetical protein PJI20_10015 [Mycobacterium kansasii]
MSLDALVEQVAQTLGGARQLYGVAPRSSQWGSTSALSGGRKVVWQASGAAAQSWRGASGSTYVSASGGQIQALDSVVGADRGTGPRFGHSAAESRAGRRGMDSVINDTRSGVAALAPSTDTPAGRQQLVNHLQSQLHRAKGLLRISEQRNITLATMIRNAASGYRPATGAAMMPAMGAPPMMGAGAPALATPNLTGLSALSRPTSRLVSGLTGTLSPGPAARTVQGALPPGRASEKGLQRNTILLNRAVSAAFPQIKEIGGWREDALHWHPDGLALDVMIPDWDRPAGKRLGDEILAWVMARKDELGVDHGIWRQAIHYDAGPGRMTEDRGSATQNHMDHLHFATTGGGYPRGDEVYRV